MLAAGCVTLLLIPLIAVALITAVLMQLLTAGPWKDAFDANHVAERLPAAVASQMSHVRASVRPTDAVTLRAGSSALTEAQLETLVRVLPSHWIRTETERLLDETFADPPFATPFIVNLAELKRYLASDAAVTAYIEVTRSLPPPEDAVATPAIRATLTSLAQALPDEVDARTLRSARATADPGPTGATLADVRRTLWLVVLSPLALVALISALVVRSRRSLMLWVGIPLVIAGATTLWAALRATGAIDEQAANAVRSSSWSPVFTQLVADVGRELAGRLVGWMAGLSLIAALSGVLLIASGRRRPVPSTGDTVPAPFYT